VKSPSILRRYRFRKFVRRHRTLVTVLALLFPRWSAAWRRSRGRRRWCGASGMWRRRPGESDAVTGFLMELFEATDPRQSGLDSLTVTTLLRHGLDRVNTLDHQPLLQAQTAGCTGPGSSRHGSPRRGRSCPSARSPSSNDTFVPTDRPSPRSYRLALNYRQQNELAPAESLITLALALEREGLHPSDPVRIRGLLTAANIAVATAQLPRRGLQSRGPRDCAGHPAGRRSAAVQSIRVMGSLLVRRKDRAVRPTRVVDLSADSWTVPSIARPWPYNVFRTDAGAAGRG
jgi:hypothetical protein